MPDSLTLKVIRILILAALAWLGIEVLDRLVPLLPFFGAEDWAEAQKQVTDYLTGDFKDAFRPSPTQISLLVSLFIGWGLDEFGIGPRIQNFLVPPHPDFLQWPIDNGTSWISGHGISIKAHASARDQLVQWLAGRLRSHMDGRPSMQGIFGPQGVGKTEIVIGAFRRLNRGRMFARWHRGRLVAPVRPGTSFRRPTAIYVDYLEDADLFWRSFEALTASGQRHPVAVIFESTADFEAMVAGRPIEKVARLRGQIDDLRKANRQTPTAVPAPALTGGPDRPLLSVQSAELAESHDEGSKYGEDFFYCREITDEKALRRLAEVAVWLQLRTPRWRRWLSFDRRQPVRRAAQLIVARSAGRPSYVLRHVRSCSPDELLRLCSDDALAQAKIDPWRIQQDEADRLVDEAVMAFPEEGLKLALLLALAQDEGLNAELRHALAPGSGDKLRLSRLVDVHRPNFNPDLYLRVPGIGSPVTAHFTLLNIMGRLQQEDIRKLAIDACRQDSAIARSLQSMLVVLLGPVGEPSTAAGYLRQYQTGIVPLLMLSGPLLMPKRQQGEKAEVVDEERFLDRIVNQALNNISLLPPQASSNERDRERDATEQKLRAIGDLVRAMTSDEQIPLLIRQKLDGKVAGVAAALLDKVPASDRKRMMIEVMRTSPALAMEIGLVIEQPEWITNAGLAELLEIIFNPGTVPDLAWVHAQMANLPETPSPNAEQRRALDALRLMNEAFLTEDVVPWEIDQETLVAQLLEGDDPVGQMSAAWATYWQVRAMDISPPVALHASIERSLWKLINDRRTRRVIWKRAAATLAKLYLPSPPAGTDDVLLVWARWVDGNLAERPTILDVAESWSAPQEPENVASTGLNWALELVGRQDERSDVRRAAALFIAACARNMDQRAYAVPAMVEAVSSDGLLDTQRETLLLRLAQLDHPDAGDALARLVRERRDGTDIVAFLALAALGKTDKLDAEDLLARPDGEAFQTAWMRLEGTAPPPASDNSRFGWFERQLIARRGHLVHKLKAKDTTGRWAYYFVLVSPKRERAFLNEIEGDGVIDLDNYGIVIDSNYGEEPSQDVIERLRRDFDFAV